MEAVAQYAAVASDAGITPTALALRCVRFPRVPCCSYTRERGSGPLRAPWSVATRVLHQPSPLRDTGVPLRAALRSRT